MLDSIKVTSWSLNVKKIQKLVIYLLSIYAILGFIALPLILKSQLIQIVQKETNAKLSLDSIYFNPFVFSLEINEIKLLDAKDSHLLSLKSILINLEPHSLFNSSIHVKNITLEDPDISLIYKKDKSINLSSIIKVKEQEAKQENTSAFEMPRVLLDKVSIKNGKINYEDYTHNTPFEFSFERIGFELRDIDTKDFNSSDATLRFHTTLGDGGFFDLKSEVLGFKPFKVKGSVDFEASKLYTQWKYMQDSLNLEVADGKVHFTSEYYFNLDDLNATSIDNLSVSIDKLRIKPKSKYKDVLNLEHFSLSDVSVKPMLRDVHVGKISLKSLYVKAKRNTAKEIDWLEYIKTEFATKDAVTEEEIEVKQESKAWNVLVDDIALEKIKIDFEDSGVKPMVNTHLNDFNLYLSNVSLAGEESFSYKMNMRVNDKFICNSKGDVKHKILDVYSYTKCSDFDVIRFAPYIDEVARDALSVYDLKLKRATLGFDANVSVLVVEEATQIRVSDANINLTKMAMNKRSTGERLVDFENFAVNNLSLDTKDKAVDIQKTTLKNLNVRAGLYKDGTLNIDNLIVAKKSKINKIDADKKTKGEPEYRVKLKHFALQTAKVSFDDKSLKPALKTKLDRINFNAYNIDSQEKTWLDYSLSVRLNSKGYAKAKGKLRHTPLKQKGTFDLQKISLREFSPYIEKNLYVKLTDGYVDLKTKIEYAKSSKVADLKVKGQLDVSEFFLNDSKNDSTLLSFNNMTLKSFDYEMSPDRAFVNELDINGFYVNAIIDENKTMNFASLSKKTNVSKSEDANATKFPFKIMKLNVASGSAKFADFSLPLDFKTDIHDLNGVVYSISSQSGEVSYVDIVGEVDEYGSTKLIGSVDSSNPKIYTDLDFNFRNIDLNSLSGYSASFAGYKIESGKLFLDLGYEIFDSEMSGKNSIIVKSIELGDEIEDENSSSLPLGFAIALLEDGDGVIDINMPVEGNVDAPDFKYGALVWKTFGNLIIKAVASPFKFLGSMMGFDGEELEFVEFEPGLMTILPPEKEKLDNISKLMLKRPKISLNIVGQYDEIQDRFIIQQQKLVKIVMEKSGAKNKKEQQNAMNVDLLEDIYEELAPKKKVSDIKKVLGKTYKGELLDRAYQKALVDETRKMQDVTLLELKTLATNRAKLLKEYLVKQKGIADNRINLFTVQNVQEEKQSWVKSKLEIDIK
ncbi:DUF748 domain-containing protein [Sulfurimonas sp.]|uniref:DUF748 domain-containing protein n=1 Tax=Sulfurimonas sp. TaxID=2022749 RepID=UPI0025FC927D|nr:DUF748 domain-containing protein [Sulfurimonas sp.]